MMVLIFPWILLAVVILSAYPWSLWLLSLSPIRESLLLPLLLTLALSIGLLTLLMFWEALLGFPLNRCGVTLPYLVLMLPGWLLWWRMRSRQTPSPDVIHVGRRFRWFAALLLVLIAAGIVFNAVYWPFSREDALAIYHRYGLEMFETGSLVPFQGRDEAFYQAYPIQMPLTYTYAYLVSGWPNEYLARLIAALFSLACLPGVYLLGKMLFGALEGWLGALLLAFTPTFARWSSTGYVDLPMAFLYTLSAIFAWRLWLSGGWIDALLTGLAMGLSAWTKNAALMGIMFWGLWLVYSWWRRRIGLSQLLAAVVGCALVAAPWYIRNYLEAHLVVPPTAWTDQAERTLSSLFVFVSQPENFFITGWLIMAGVGWGVWKVVRWTSDAQPYAFLLLWTLPFFGIWWLLVSYDPRFLLLFLPLLCVLAGTLAAVIWKRLPLAWKKWVTLPLAASALLLALYITWISVEFKPEILRDPLMKDAAKHEIVLGER